MSDVTTRHSAYMERAPGWRIMRDVYEGSPAIKGAATTYLPRLDKQTPQQYDAYLQRALYFAALPRTIGGLSGAVFQKAPAVVAPERIQPHLQDVSLTDEALPAFAMRVLREVLLVGRYGVLVDLPPSAGVTPRPYWIGYRAEQIVNWRTVHRDGNTIPTLVVLREFAEVPRERDRFAVDAREQYRVLELVPRGATSRDLVYQVTLWRQQHNSRDFVPGEAVRPTRRGEPLDFIPFVFFGPSGNGATPEKPPLSDLAEVNLSHYRSSADLEHGRHYTALPTPWASGYKGDALTIGPAVAWTFEDPQARCGMLEFTGQGLGALERALESKERMMATLGARLLESQKRDTEAAETVRLRHSGEHSILSGIAQAISAGLTATLRTHAWWSAPGNVDDTQDVSITLNTEFFSMRLSAEDLKALMLVWQAGGISFDTLYAQLERGQISRPGITVDEERHAIDASQDDDIDDAA